MNFCDFLPLEAVRVVAANTINSRKKALETLADMLAETTYELDKNVVFHLLVEREKLSTTALGSGIAVPHCRVPNTRAPHAALLRVTPGIDYDAPDQAPVTMLFALLVPEDAIDEHLKILASLATTLNDGTVRDRLNQADSPQALLTILKSTADG